MNLSKSDTSKLCRYLRDAIAFYRHHAVSVREQDRARLLSVLLHKIERKIQTPNN